MPELMKIFENVKKGLEEEYAANPEALSALEPIMHIHSCTVEIYLDSSMDRKYGYAAKKLIDRITKNKTIIMLR
jgi:L-2-hydroxyglutarate oxidase LhgO